MKSIDDWLKEPASPAGAGLLVQIISFFAFIIVAGVLYTFT